MTTMWNWLKGKKSYAIALAGIVYAGGIQQGWWTHQPIIDGLFASGALASIRHGITTSAESVAPTPPGVAKVATTP